MPEHKSWGHRISKLRFPGIEKCSAPGCAAHPEFRVFLMTGSGSRRLNYCRAHAFDFSKNYRVGMPLLDSEDAKRVDLHRFTDEALGTLLSRINDEQRNRRQRPDDKMFSFDEIGMGKAAPYAARLRIKDGKVDRFFFKLQWTDLGHGRVRVHGKYTVRPGSIVEKRIDDTDGHGSWNRYLIDEDGSEVLVAMKDDRERNEQVEKYLKRETDRKRFTESCEG
ncbi:hypothetical protein [Pseudodesulfovibrio pelocollis]|uniref:hypothetical protein n=1 Tax=Pseudodesulfovibrio pelocollis TaxID=3051432 RepID=UPI00255B2F61|nr:hypothetical protein [Pseudodesulfovibrio sp. SB368]